VTHPFASAAVAVALVVLVAGLGGASAHTFGALVDRESAAGSVTAGTFTPAPDALAELESPRTSPDGVPARGPHGPRGPSAAGDDAPRTGDSLNSPHPVVPESNRASGELPPDGDASASGETDPVANESASTDEEHDPEPGDADRSSDDSGDAGDVDDAAPAGKPPVSDQPAGADADPDADSDPDPGSDADPGRDADAEQTREEDDSTPADGESPPEEGGTSSSGDSDSGSDESTGSPAESGGHSSVDPAGSPTVPDGGGSP
jgi:hypothetical protein